MAQEDEFSYPLVPIAHAREFLSTFAQTAVLSAAAKEHMPYFRLQGIVETNNWGAKVLRCPDTGEAISLGHTEKLFSCDDGVLIEAAGRPFIGMAKKSGGLFINFDVEDWRYVDEEYASHASQSSTSLEFIKHILKEQNINGHGLQSRKFPQSVHTISIIVSKFNGSTALKDILGDFNKEGYELDIRYVAISSAREICTAIAKARGQVLVIARGGGPEESLEAFNNINVLRALNETDKYRILGLGHATDVTLADFFADTRAQTPTAAGTALKRLLGETKEKQRLKKLLEEAKRGKSGTSFGLILAFLAIGVLLGIYLSRYL